MCKKLSLLLILIIAATSACNKTTTVTDDDTPCAPQACTMEFRSVTIKFVDKAGNPVVVQNFKSINQRTGQPIKWAGPNSVTQYPGYYSVANDSDLKELSTNGDDVAVSGTNPANGQTKTVTFKISGGCSCHINKISGPAEVAFD